MVQTRSDVAVAAADSHSTPTARQLISIVQVLSVVPVAAMDSHSNSSTHVANDLHDSCSGCSDVVPFSDVAVSGVQFSDAVRIQWR